MIDTPSAILHLLAEQHHEAAQLPVALHRIQELEAKLAVTEQRVAELERQSEPDA